MRGNRTFTMIKPDAVKNGYAGKIIDMIIKNEFQITAMKYTLLSHDEAKKFYEIHRDRPFFKDLVDFMTSGNIIAAVLQKENAVDSFRKLIGTTDPEKADEGTVRRKFASSISENAIHGSDSDENANIEIAFHFSEREIYSN